MNRGTIIIAMQVGVDTASKLPFQMLPPLVALRDDVFSSLEEEKASSSEIAKAVEKEIRNAEEAKKKRKAKEMNNAQVERMRLNAELAKYCIGDNIPIPLKSISPPSQLSAVRDYY